MPPGGGRAMDGCLDPTTRLSLTCAGVSVGIKLPGVSSMPSHSLLTSYPIIHFADIAGGGYKIYVDEVLRFVMIGDSDCILDQMGWLSYGGEFIRAVQREFEEKLHALWFPAKHAPSFGFEGFDGTSLCSDFVVC